MAIARRRRTRPGITPCFLWMTGLLTPKSFEPCPFQAICAVPQDILLGIAASNHLESKPSPSSSRRRSRAPVWRAFGT